MKGAVSKRWRVSLLPTPNLLRYLQYLWMLSPVELSVTLKSAVARMKLVNYVYAKCK